MNKQITIFVLSIMAAMSFGSSVALGESIDAWGQDGHGQV